MLRIVVIAVALVVAVGALLSYNENGQLYYETLNPIYLTSFPYRWFFGGLAVAAVAGLSFIWGPFRRRKSNRDIQTMRFRPGSL